MADRARRAKIIVSYAGNGSSHSNDVMSDYIQAFEWQDNASSEADTVALTMQNIDHKWLSSWKPKKGDKLTAKIKVFDWKEKGDKEEVDCGKFCVDTMSFSGPDLTSSLGGTSVPESSSFRSTARNKVWKKVTLQEIQQKIAGKYHMKAVYEADKIYFKKLEQSDNADCSFLQQICDDYGLAFKIYAGKVVIYDKGKLEEKAPVATIGKANLMDWEYNSSLVGTYTGATAKYQPENAKKVMSVKVGKGNRYLTITEKCEDLADARMKARQQVNAANESADTMSLSIFPNTKIVSGVTVTVKDLWKANGKYFIDKVTYSFDGSSGLTQKLEMHKVVKRI